MQRYVVSRKGPVVEAILDALEESGATIVESPDPRSAPFEIGVRTKAGDDLDLVCYAFLANRYRQGGRPPDEHRFQVKYGSEFHRYHEIFLDRRRTRTTLMFGVHLEAGIFIAVDPAMHNPTFFSRSVEFKDSHVEAAQRKGWVGWERERCLPRRKIPPPRESYTVEALLAFRPERFGSYVAFERMATGIDPGERLLLIDRLEDARALERRGRHPLEVELGLDAFEIMDLVGSAFRLHSALRGQAAEHYLGRLLRNTPGITGVRHIDEDGKPDFEVTYAGRTRSIECKNVLRRRPPGGLARVDFQKTRASKKDPCSRYYDPSQFDVLAACLHPVVTSWDFRFRPTRELAPHRWCGGRLADRVVVTEEAWPQDVREALDRV